MLHTHTWHLMIRWRLPQAAPLPPGVPELRQRACAHEEDEEVTAAATEELAPRVAFLTSDGAPRGVVTNINTHFHIISPGAAGGADRLPQRCADLRQHVRGL